MPKTVLKNTYYTVNTLSKIKINLFYFYLGNGLKKYIAKIPTDLSSAWCKLLTGTFINVRPYWGIYFHTEGYIKLRNWKEKNQTTLLFSSMLIWEIIVRLQKPPTNGFPYLGNQKWYDTEPLTVFVSPTVTAQELSVKN